MTREVAMKGLEVSISTCWKHMIARPQANPYNTSGENEEVCLLYESENWISAAASRLRRTMGSDDIFVSYLMCTNTTTLRTSKMFALFSEHERTRKCLTSPNLLIPIPSKPYSSYHCYHRHNTSTKWVKNRLGLTGKVIILFPIIPISSSWLLKAHWHQIKSTQKAVVVPEICNVFYSHLLDT